MRVALITSRSTRLAVVLIVVVTGFNLLLVFSGPSTDAGIERLEQQELEFHLKDVAHAYRSSGLTNVSGAVLYHVQPRYINVIAKPRSRNDFLTIGIPSAKRPTGDVYVLDTIQSILNATSQTDRDRVVVVVFLTDFDVAYNTRLSAAIVERYGRHIDSGLIHVVQVARDVYPPLDGLKRNFNDAKERVYWRAKQVVDFALMFLYAPNVSRYYIQIEDDVRCANGFVPSIERFLNGLVTHRRPWTIVDFSTLGFIGKLLRSSDLRTFAQFLLLFYQEQPVDYLLRAFRVAVAQHEVVMCRPTLFQHVGLKSSLRLTAKDIDNTLKDKYFDDGVFHNPRAVVVASMKTRGNRPQRVYDMATSGANGTFFVAENPHYGSTVDVTFSDPVRLRRVVVVTGSSYFPKQFLHSGVLEAHVKPSDNTENVSCVIYMRLGNFIDGVVDVSVPTFVLPICSLHVRVMQDHETDVVFRQIAVFKA